MTIERTRVAIVGAGPAGLVLSHLLQQAGIDSIVVDQRSREDIEGTIKAGILEQGAVDLLASIGTTSRVHAVGDKHDGIVNWILYDHPRAKQRAPRPLGRFSPLLPPTEET